MSRLTALRICASALASRLDAVGERDAAQPLRSATDPAAIARTSQAANDGLLVTCGDDRLIDDLCTLTLAARDAARDGNAAQVAL